ncbi:hypothetical protein MMC11_001575 [Xylographa trunciseda]|nr:hypothetical protein [Xylographa trunciseda]
MSYDQIEAKQWFKPRRLRKRIPLPTTLRDFYICFDNWLFAGALQLSLVEVKLVDHLDVTVWGATFYQNHSSPERPSVTIEISSRHANKKEPSKELLRTLPHEMVHAFLMMFHCHCLECRKNSIATIGTKGHGNARETLCLRIEETLIGEQLDLNIPNICQRVGDDHQWCREYAYRWLEQTARASSEQKANGTANQEEDGGGESNPFTSYALGEEHAALSSARSTPNGTARGLGRRTETCGSVRSRGEGLR